MTADERKEWEARKARERSINDWRKHAIHRKDPKREIPPMDRMGVRV